MSELPWNRASGIARRRTSFRTETAGRQPAKEKAPAGEERQALVAGKRLKIA